jgi:hypothetical protein
MTPCLPCTIGKAKQKNTVKMSNHETCSYPGERIFTDIASIRASDGIKVSKPHWCIKVDERTQLNLVRFMKTKMAWSRKVVNCFTNGDKVVTK